MNSYWRKALAVLATCTVFGTLAGFMVCRSMPVIYEATAVFAAKNPDRLNEMIGIGGRFHKELVRDVTETYRTNHPSSAVSDSELEVILLRLTRIERPRIESRARCHFAVVVRAADAALAADLANAYVRTLEIRAHFFVRKLAEDLQEKELARLRLEVDLRRSILTRANLALNAHQGTNSSGPDAASNRTPASLQVLIRDLDVANREYQIQAEEAFWRGGGESLAEVAVVQNAQTPSRPVWPRYHMVVPSGSIAGAFLGAIAASVIFLRQRRR